MKGLIVAVVLVGVVLLLAFTNPDLDAYSDYLGDEMASEAKEEGELAGALASLLGGVAGSIFANATERDNFVLFSIYTTAFDSDELVVLGILGNFIVLSEPQEQ